MWLHHAGYFAERENDAADWEKRLVSLYREKAISALKEATGAAWPKPEAKRVFAYLRAELTRKTGRKSEALVLFQEVIAAEKSAERNEELEWISRWAEEQSLLCTSDAKGSAKPGESPVANAAGDSADASKEADKAWRHDVLLPAVRKAVVDEGLPAVEMPLDEDPLGQVANPLNWQRNHSHPTEYGWREGPASS